MGMEEKGQVLDRIRSATFPGKRSRVAKYILDHHIEAAFLTAAELARRAGVSEPTVIRFATDLGFPGYPALQRALQDLVQQELTTVDRIRIQALRRQNKDPAVQSLWQDLRNLEETIKLADPKAIGQVVERLAAADRVIVVGLRMSAALASYMRLSLKKSIPTVVAVTKGDGSFFDELVWATRSSVVVGISFPRYSRATPGYLAAARAKGVTTVAITDSELSPLVSHADHVLLARCRALSYVDSFAAPIALIGAVATALSLRAEHTQRLEELEALWKRHQVFH
ncbi:MAG: Transcriptional regulator, RpiR family [Acetothermia bacterium 64_32]|nr:MAG: Transcriptional regulator, RpiR family [Acetothermia bacterium 64_32]HAF70818.1 N-acetylmannosamine kinase [Candidatus Acetothermia bacterium]